MSALKPEDAKCAICGKLTPYCRVCDRVLARDGFCDDCVDILEPGEWRCSDHLEIEL